MEMYERGKVETEAKDDPKARELLKGAFEKTERWPKGFSGYAADLSINNNGKEFQGKIEIVPGKEVEIGFGDDAVRAWAKNQLAMMSVHRAHRSFEESDGKYVLTLGAEDHHPLGRLVYIHGDGMNSRYRIKNDRILQINRTMGKMRFTINIQDTIATKSGKHLTSHYTVYYYSVPEGTFLQAESIVDRHVPVNEVYLPERRQVLSSDKGEVVVRTTEFSNHKLL
jgi:hypothetical protein